MKVWELEEGKMYRCIKKYRVRNRGNHTNLQVFETATETWEDINLSLDAIKNWNFEEIVDTNSHWKPEKESFCFINENLQVSRGSVAGKFDDSYVNMFHIDDIKKAICLSLETRIKATIINWRRLHDDVELDMNDRNYIMYDLENNKITFDWEREFITCEFGYFSTREKAQQFYQYMKDDIDRYFEMRKKLKF